MGLTCHYCKNLIELVRGGEIYPQRPDLWKKYFWLCRPCEAWVGCHPRSTEPLGIVANAELRKLKSNVHALFDPIWKSGEMTRSRAYEWLSRELGIPAFETHVGMFTPEICRRAIMAIQNRVRE